MIKAISLGWGVQSVTLMALCVYGDLEMVDFAIHSDTTHESIRTYEYKEKWQSFFNIRGMRIVEVANPDPLYSLKKQETYIPAYIKNGGMRLRICTNRWKIRPMMRAIQARRNGKQVEQWLGISLDEYQRMKDNKLKFITNRFPLIELKMTRDDCKEYLKKHNIEIPPKSSCVFCPYHSRAGWRDIALNEQDYKEAVKADNFIRNKRPPDLFYVHNKRRPLEELDLIYGGEKGQMLLPEYECESGYCFV